MDSTASVPAPPPVAVTAPAVYNSVKDIPFVFDPSQPSYSLAEVAQHSDPASPWIVVITWISIMGACAQLQTYL